jgi:hypothetical protein
MFVTKRRPSKIRFVTPLFIAVGFGLGTGGCVDKEKCDEAIRVTRDALAKEQPDIARQWRERAWKICNDATTTATLDKEIVDKEAALAKRAADAVKAVGESAQQRINAATAVWRGFDKLDEKERTPESLEAYRQKAARMSQGLPPEYAAQIDTYNSGEFEKRRAALKPAKK